MNVENEEGRNGGARDEWMRKSEVMRRFLLCWKNS